MAAIAREGAKDTFIAIADNELLQLEKIKHFIGLRSVYNSNALSDITKEQMKLLLRHYVQPVHYEFRSRLLNWIYLRWPTREKADTAGQN